MLDILYHGPKDIVAFFVCFVLAGMFWTWGARIGGKLP